MDRTHRLAGQRRVDPQIDDRLQIDQPLPRIGGDPLRAVGAGQRRAVGDDVGDLGERAAGDQLGIGVGVGGSDQAHDPDQRDGDAGAGERGRHQPRQGRQRSPLGRAGPVAQGDHNPADLDQADHHQRVDADLLEAERDRQRDARQERMVAQV